MNGYLSKIKPWDELNGEELRNCYQNLKKLLSKEIVRSAEIKSLNNNSNLLTKAEYIGHFVRDMFEIHKEFLKSIRSQGEWIALKIRTTEHSIADYKKAILINDLEEGEIQVYGFKLKPNQFKFEWVDNSHEKPWRQIGWPIPLYSDDMDEKTYFLNNENSSYTVGYLNTEQVIEFYGVKMKPIKLLSTFKMINN